MTPPPNTFQIPLSRGDGVTRLRVFRGAPLRIEAVSGWDLTGVSRLRLEIHGQRAHEGRTPLAVAEAGNPTGTEAVFEFSWEEMCLPLEGRISRTFYLLFRAVLEDGARDVYELGTLEALSSPASDLAPADPDQQLYVTYERLEEETGARQAADSALAQAFAESVQSEALARESADNALTEALTAGLQSEAQARAAADQALTGAISDLASAAGAVIHSPANPTTTDIPEGGCRVWRNTVTGLVRNWANIGGVMLADAPWTDPAAADPVVYGAARAGAVLAREGMPTPLFSGEVYPGYTITAADDDTWSVNHVSTGLNGETYTVPPGAVPGDEIRWSGSAPVTVEVS